MDLEKILIKTGFGKRFGNAFNAGFRATTNRYMGAVVFLIRRKWLAVFGLAIVIGLTIWEVRTTPTGFIPAEDQNFLMLSVNLPLALPHWIAAQCSCPPSRQHRCHRSGR